MDSELQNKLYEKYPKIFRQKDMDKTETLMCWGISCGNGWFNIIDTLCREIQDMVDKPHKNIELYAKFSKEARENGDVSKSRMWEGKIAEERLKIIPQVEAVQVKEKYGTLRFYVNHHSEIIDAIISFAEEMSGVTCDACGSPGQSNNRGWISTMCNPCREEKSNNRTAWLDAIVNNEEPSSDENEE